MAGNFSELTRVQIPALVHLTRLEYRYLRKMHENEAGTRYDPDTHILLDVFKEKFAELNPESSADDVLREIRQELDYDDLGASFYKRLPKLIDFKNPKNNVFHCVQEFTCRWNENRDTNRLEKKEFRPDITLFVNGLPLVFVEVKIPDNNGGRTAESDRMGERFRERKFRRFINITQLMIFANNAEYGVEDGVTPIQGAFYCTAARENASFNCFREENPRGDVVAPFIDSYKYSDIDKETEREILNDSGCVEILGASEYKTNLEPTTPTNRILTSMCSPERLIFLLKYGIVYVRYNQWINGKMRSVTEKHIMRYQQMFAALAVRQKLYAGIKSGIIWHTQGSGKTALSFYLHKVLSDFYGKQGIATKFYFIVDRLALLNQARDEFEARGLVAMTPGGRDTLMDQFADPTKAKESSTGADEIVVVNIQRFKPDAKVKLPPSETYLQRIFIIDEAHRSYAPKGSFLANLLEADPYSIKIALTGTPLLKEERASWKIFGDYIHVYYYDKSIQDGYTLKIIRQNIETSSREKLLSTYKGLEAKIASQNIETSSREKLRTYKGLDALEKEKKVKKNAIVENEAYVKELLRYIIVDLKNFRLDMGDNTLGGMVVCETTTQAKMLYSYFDEIQKELNSGSFPSDFKAGLVLDEVDDLECEKAVNDFKKNMTIDILIVVHMLITGFDAPRLKRLYLGRKLKDHTLLQAITRVNRPYNGMSHGYLVDFADIKENFDETNRAYLEELSKFNDPEEKSKRGIVSHIMENPEDLLQRMEEVHQKLLYYTIDNAEVFRKEISEIKEKQELLDLRNALVNARECRNLARTIKDDKFRDRFSKMDISKLPELLSCIRHRINIINLQKELKKGTLNPALLNQIMHYVTFSFEKTGEEEMKLIHGRYEELDRKWAYAFEILARNTDQEASEYVKVSKEYYQKFKEYGVDRSVEKYEQSSKDLDEIIEKLKKLERKNLALQHRYREDCKFMRVHNRICEQNFIRKGKGDLPIISDSEKEIVDVLLAIKDSIDNIIYKRRNILREDDNFGQKVMTIIVETLEAMKVESSLEDQDILETEISKQYINQYNAANSLK